MVQYNKNIKNKKKGFTLVELMVVLAITAILAVLVGGGLIAYTRLARFEKNEANARTLFQTAQISLTRMETAGELDAFRRQVMEEGDTGDHFQNDVTVTDADGKTLVSRTKTELDANVAALYYDRMGAAAGNHNALVKELLGDYIYDASLLNASICVEIDVQSGQVYSVFYDTKSDKLRFNQDGATNIYDRSYDHRRNDTLVGYYSAEDRVNVVQLVQTKLKVKNPRLTNGETLTLSWSGNSSLGDLDTSYTATAYDAKDTGKTKPLFTITIKRDTAGAADDNKQVITKMPVTIYTYNDAGNQAKTEKELYFPLSYNKGSFVLTLDAMADAALLRALAGDAGKVVYKPNCKGQGTGVRILPAVTEAEQADTLAYLRANSGGIVEEYIQQHPTLAQLNPGAVSIVRFYTVTAPSGTYLFAPVLTAAIEKDISNGCQDALTAMIDIRTGVVLTDAVDQNNCIDYAAHPVTGVAFPGLQLPFWDETIDMMRRAVPLASKISNIGWDVTMTADGPLIIEANTIPGFNTAQYRGYAWVTDGYGYQPLFDELNGKPFVPNNHYARVLLKLA